jgi:hypothetical protein
VKKIKTELEIKEPDYTHTLKVNKSGTWNEKIMIGTPMTGLLRAEWVLARFGQVIPTNWSSSDFYPPVNTYAPLRYLVADAQNLIVKALLDKGVEWLMMVEHDNVIPPDCFIRINEYMRDKKIPVVSGLYFTKSVPPEPMIYRGSGNSFYTNWHLGDKVWCSGVPMGCTLIHATILKKMWEESPEYKIGNDIVRRVFDAPAKVWYDPQKGGFMTAMGTSDLNWCHRVMTEGFFEKAGWGKYQKMDYPFMVDTNIFVRHIDENGRQFPIELPERYNPLPAKKEELTMTHKGIHK